MVARLTTRDITILVDVLVTKVQTSPELHLLYHYYPKYFTHYEQLQVCPQKPNGHLYHYDLDNSIHRPWVSGL